MKTSIFKSGGEYRLQIVDDPDKVRQVKRWTFAEETAWGVNCYVYIFRIPQGKAKWVSEKLGLKNPKPKRSVKQEVQTENLIEHGAVTQFVVPRSRQNRPLHSSRVAATYESAVAL